MSEQNKGGIVKAILFIARLRCIPDIRSQSITLKPLVIPALLFVVASAANAQQTIDVRTFGTYATFSSTTTKTTLRQPTVFLDDTQSFKSGEYVTIFHAGPSCRLSVPRAPSVTPSVNTGDSEKMLARSGSAGFRSWNRPRLTSLVATRLLLRQGQLLGNALGGQTTSINSWTRTNNLQTVETTTAHGLVVGQLIYIKYFQH